MFCPLKQMEFSTRSAQLHPNPMGMVGVPPRGTGAREGKRVLVEGISAMVGISVETRQDTSHTTAHMVRCQKHICFCVPKWTNSMT